MRLSLDTSIACCLGGVVDDLSNESHSGICVNTPYDGIVARQLEPLGYDNCTTSVSVFNGFFELGLGFCDSKNSEIRACIRT